MKLKKVEKKLNAIIMGFIGFTQDIILKIILQHEFDKIVVISSPRLKKRNNDVEFIDFIELLDYDAFLKGIDWTKIPPLDAHVISMMADSESQFFDMINRSTIRKKNLRRLRDYYYRCLRFANHILISNDIRIIIMGNVPHQGIDFVFYSLAKKSKIHTICMYQMPLVPKLFLRKYILLDIYNQNRFFLNDLEQNTNFYKDKKNKFDNLPSDIRDYINYVRNNSSQPFTRSSTNLSSMPLILDFFRTNIFTNKIKNDKSIIRYVSQSLYILFIEFTRDVRKNFLLWYYNKIAVTPELKGNFLYFPLNYQPEASTLPLAGYYSDLILIIEMVLYCLPENYKLYIKEHPRMSINRNKEYYNRLYSMKNLVLVKTNFNSRLLIEHSKAVVVTTGSAGLEAFTNKIPVLMFGSRIYQYAKGVYKINSLKELHSAMNMIINEKDSISDSDVYSFFKTLDDHTCKGFMSPKDVTNASSELIENNSDNIANLLLKYIKILDKSINPLHNNPHE